MGKKISMLRKAVAGILSAAVFTGSVFTGTVVAAGIEETVPSSRQIVTNGLAETNEDNVTVSKTVRETGTENEFEITLKVTTREKLEEIPTSSDAAVVLVMDTSGSMDGDRLTAAKKAAKSFVDKYVKDSKPTDKRYAALVEFANDAETIIGWTNLAQGTTNFENAIKRLKAGGGTNMEAGLQLAYNLINAGKSNLLKDCKNINVILLSDGCPTYHVDESTRNSTTKVKGVRGGGNEAYPEDWKSVETIAGSIRDDKINLYSVAFQTGSETFWDFKAQPPKNGICVNLNHWYNGVHGRWSSEQKKVSDWMNTFSDKCFSAKDADKLSVSFENIAKLIKLGAQAWKVTDPMGQFIHYDGVANSPASEDNKYTFANNTLTWDLKASVPTELKTDQVTTYTYTLTYPITLNTAGAGFVSEKAYDTNGTTTLYYYLFSKVDDSTNVPETPKTLDFNVPTVKGYLGSLSFRKVDQDGNALPGASFAISNTSLTGVSDTNGNVTIEGIPSGFNYTLTETKMDGYLAMDPISFKVSYGEVSKADGTSLATVTNTKEENDKYVVIKHEYYDADGYLYARIDDDFSHMAYKEGFVPDPDRIYEYGGMTFEAWGDATAEWVYNAEDADNMGKHDDYVITLKYKQKSEVPEVKDYTVVIHKYFDADGNLVAEVKDADFDHMLDKEGFEPVPVTTYDGVEYVVRDSYDGWVKDTTDDAISEKHNDHVYTIEYQKKSVEVKDYVVIIHKYFDADGNLVAEVRDTDFDHMLDKEGFEPMPETTYDGVEYVVREIKEAWVNRTTDTVIGVTHNDHVFTIEYQVKKGAEEVKDYVVIIHKYFDVDGNLVAEVRDADFDHMLDKEGFEPVPVTTYDGVEYVVRDSYDGWVKDTTDDAISEKHNDHVYTIEYQKKSVEVKDYVVIIHKYFDADGNLVAEVRDTDFDHMLDKEGFEPMPETTYDGVEYVVREIKEAWVNRTTDTVIGVTHNDHVFTIEYQVKKGAEEVKDYVVIIHKYFDVDGNLVAEVRDTDFDHMLDKEGFEPEPETTYDGVEYAIRDSYDGWVLNTTDNAVGEVHNDHVFTIEYQVEDDGPRYSKIRVNHEYYTDGNRDGTEIEEFDYSEDFAPTQKPEYSEKTYTYVSTTGPKDIGDGYLEYTLVYRRTTELPPNPPVVDDTIIVIEKSWENAEPYDGRIIFTATNEKTGRSYTGTLRAGRNRAVITVPAGGTYIISEDVPEGYTPSFPEGDTVYVRTGSSATIHVVNSGEEEEEIDDDDTPLAPGPVDPVKPGDSDEVIDDETTPLVDPPKTGAAVRGLSVLFGAAAAALVGAVVLRKKKEK